MAYAKALTFSFERGDLMDDCPWKEPNGGEVPICVIKTVLDQELIIYCDPTDCDVLSKRKVRPPDD